MTTSDSDSEELPEEGDWDLDEDEEGEGEGDEPEEDANNQSEPGSGPNASGSFDGNRRGRGRADDRAAYEAADDRARKALDFVSRVVLNMGMDCRVRLRPPNDGNAPDEINLEISGRDSGRIIGKKGQVLQALQFLVHRVVNRPGLERRHILVDAEGYRNRRDLSLANMARRLGKQAVDEGKIITFEPMNPRDRRVVHLALAKFEGVITRSDGEGDQRRVQIIPVRRPAAVEP
jgi:spoIIIJ-associated protein